MLSHMLLPVDGSAISAKAARAARMACADPGGFLLGSVTSRVLANADIPVIVYR